MNLLNAVNSWDAQMGKKAEYEAPSTVEPMQEGEANKVGSPELKPKQEKKKTYESMEARPVPKEPIEGIMDPVKEDKRKKIMTKKAEQESKNKTMEAVKELWFDMSGMDKSSSFSDQVALKDDNIILEKVDSYLQEKKASEGGWDARDKDLFEKSARALFQKAKGWMGRAPKPTQGPGMLAPPTGAPAPNPYMGNQFTPQVPTIGPGMLAPPAAGKPFMGTKAGIGLGLGGLGAGYFGGRGVGRSQGMDAGYAAAENYYNQAANNTGLWDRILQLFTGQKFSPEQIGLGRQMMAQTPRGELFDRFYTS